MIINEINFPIYKILIVISILVGITYIIMSLYNEKKLNKKLIIFFIMFFILSLLFGKLYTYILWGFQTTFIDSPLSSYGGLIGVLISALIYEKIYPSKGLVIKYTVLSLPLIYAFTKIACSVVGCCYGIPYDGIFAVKYPHRIDEFLFPIQFLEVIIFFILFLICNAKKNRKDITYITILSISILKFAVEYLRYNDSTLLFNQNQLFSIALFIITLIFYKKNN